MLTKFPLWAAILVMFVVMLTMSIIAFWAKPAIQPVPNDFAGGFQQGFATSAVSSTLISAIIFGVIAGLRRTRMTMVGAAILVLFAARHLHRFVITFPAINDAAWALAPHLTREVFLSPINWVNYFIIYRAYRELRTEAPTPSFERATDTDLQ